MSFTDFGFYPKTVFLFLVLRLVQFLFRKKQDVAGVISKLVLLAYSFYILMYYDYRYAGVLLAVIVVTYFFARVIDNNEDKRRSVATTIGVVLLVCILGIFKYLNFFATTICSVIGTSWTEVNIILPLGISFYIFSAISYLLDVYWKTMEADKNIINVALFLAFFPKLVCGPILKGRDFLPQLQSYRKIEWKNFCEGIQIFVFGFYKKVVLADRLGIFVDDVFFAPTAYNTGTVILAAFTYSLQIYFDFSGYSDMAIGISKILGYDIPSNFNLPYLSRNVSDFWKRWHISLSSWFQEYLYIPLGGSRKGKLRTYINLMLVMVISGLWHGAGWTFIVWGLFHGLFNCINKAVKKIDKQNEHNFLHIILTYIVVTLLWVIFRADSMENAMQVLKSMFTIHTGISQPYTWSFFAYVVLIVGTVMAYRKSYVSENPDINGYYPIQDLSTVKGLTIFFVVCGLSIIMGYFGETYFIYGAF